MGDKNLGRLRFAGVSNSLKLGVWTTRQVCLWHYNTIYSNGSQLSKLKLALQFDILTSPFWPGFDHSRSQPFNGLSFHGPLGGLIMCMLVGGGGICD